MSRSAARAAARPLPPGLCICSTCGEARGTTREGRVSACYCSGAVCNRCGTRARRPISDYWDRRAGRWWHVPWFGLMAHTCRLAPGEAPRGSGWTMLQPDPEVVAHQEAVTRATLAAPEGEGARATPAESVERPPSSPRREYIRLRGLDLGRDDRPRRRSRYASAGAEVVPTAIGHAGQHGTEMGHDRPDCGRGYGGRVGPDRRREGRRTAGMSLLRRRRPVVLDAGVDARDGDPGPGTTPGAPFVCASCGRSDLPPAGDWDPAICVECDAEINFAAVEEVELTDGL